MPAISAGASVDQIGDQRGFLERAHLEIIARVIERPDFGHHLVQQLLRRLAGTRRHLGHQHPHQHAIPFGDMALDADAARLLTADQHVIAEHQIADVIEAHRRLVQGQAVNLGQPVEHLGGGNRLDHCAGLAAAHQITQRQGHDRVRINEAPRRPDCARPVGIAVHRQTQIIVASGHLFDERNEMPGDRLRVNAVETGVHLAANLNHLRAGFEQQVAQIPAP